MSFVTNLDAPAPQPLPEPAPDPDRVITGGWFPDIDPAWVRSAHRIRDGVTAARLREALLAAIISVGNDLAAWQEMQASAGHADLAAVPAALVDEESRLLICYRRAVALTAKAEIVERYRDIDMSASGERGAEELEPSIGELRRDALHAIRDILGKSRTTVDLI